MQLQPGPSLLIQRLITFAFALTIITGGILICNISQQSIHAQPNTSTTIGGCPVFPANNIWNRDISNLPVRPNSANYIATIGGSSASLLLVSLANSQSSDASGFPFVVVNNSQPLVKIVYTEYGSESDPGPIPIPPDAPIENSPDRHILVVNKDTCKLYELFKAYPQQDGSWQAGGGAIYDLSSNALRPLNWAPVDGAGLPILPGLVRYDEIAAGAIRHALRLVVRATGKNFWWPARASASSDPNPNLPGFGLRLRLKASVDISGFSATDRIILAALKHYGAFIADNGPNSLELSGAPDKRWNNDNLHALSNIPASDFEVVDESSLQISQDSGQAREQSTSSTPTPTPTRAHTTSPPPTPTPTLTPTRAHTTSPSPTPVPTTATVPTQAEVTESKNLKGNNTTGGGIGTLLFLGDLTCVLTLTILGAWYRLSRKHAR
jgi:hypothetical protein